MFYVCWPYGSRDAGEGLKTKELVDAELFLTLDPLVSISTAIAARAWVWSLTAVAAILVVCMVFPRGYCGYICPLGTLLDLVDWAIGKRMSRFRIIGGVGWTRMRYGLLAVVLLAAGFGTMLAGFVAAIPVLTRGIVFALNPIQMGLLRGWYLVPPMNAGHYIAVGLLTVILALCFLDKRFWCKYVCLTGAVFSVGSLLRLTERKVNERCVACGRCEAVCDFAAIREDYSTVHTNCSFCQSCGGVFGHAILNKNNETVQ